MQKREQPVFQVTKACQLDGVWTTQASIIPGGQKGHLV